MLPKIKRPKVLESTRNEGLGLPATLLAEEPLPHYLKQRAAGGERESALPLTGLVRRSPSPGRWLIHPTLDMIRCLEIAESDIVDFEMLTAEQSPFGRIGGTRVLVKKNAEIQTNWAASRLSDDEFDLDIQIGAAGGREPHDICEGSDDGTTCDAPCSDGCEQSAECGGSDDCGGISGKCPTGECPKTHHTCPTDCPPATCKGNTCVNTFCDQPSCQGTCETKCRQATCTCETCVACTHVTCGHQPGCQR